MELVHGGDWMGYRERFGRDALDFSANVSPLGLPEGVAQAIRDALPQADRILADVPCSGLGILAKKPDLRYKKMEPAREAELLATQSAILDTAAQLLKPGGRLVYSTCTILPEENEQVTDAFLAEHSDFCRDGFTLPAPVGETEGQLTLWPQRHGTDGFYICRMRRRG